MEKLTSKLATTAIRDRSAKSTSTKWPGAEGRDEVVRIVLKLFALYPRSADPAFTVEAYVDELSPVPCFWLRKACRSITSRTKNEQNWLPLVGDIKNEAAKLHQEYRNQAQHGLPYDPKSVHRRLAVGREIHLMAKGPLDPSRQIAAGGGSND